MRNLTGMSIGYYDLCQLSSDQFARLIQAAAAYLKAVSAGRKSFVRPEFYPGYVKQFENLLDMLKSNPRAGRLAS